MFGTLGVDSLQGLLQLLCILVHFFLNSFSKIAVDLVPGLGLLGDIVFFPFGDVSFDEVDPQLVVVFHDVRRLHFDGSLEPEDNRLVCVLRKYRCD